MNWVEDEGNHSRGRTVDEGIRRPNSSRQSGKIVPFDDSSLKEHSL